MKDEGAQSLLLVYLFAFCHKICDLHQLVHVAFVGPDQWPDMRKRERKKERKEEKQVISTVRLTKTNLCSSKEKTQSL